MESIDQLADLFSFPNFVPESYCAISPDGHAVTIPIKEDDRPQKVSAADAVVYRRPSTTAANATSAICPQAATTQRWSCQCADCVAVTAEL
jgi:hypothetical protein